MGKEQFREADKALKVVGVKFAPGDCEFMRQTAHVPIFNNKLYEDVEGKLQPANYGPLDPKMGVSTKTGTCSTCGLGLTDCVGHFGYFDLDVPVFHIGFFKLTIQLLQCICKNCSSILLTPEQHRVFSRQVMNPNLDYLHRKALHKRIVAACKKGSTCSHCGLKNGTVKKAVGAVLKIAFASPVSVDELGKFATMFSSNQEVGDHVRKMKFTLLNPLFVQKLFSNIKEGDIPVLMVRSGEEKHPNDLLLTRMPVPPVCIRPSVVSEVKAGTTEDDVTMKLMEIMLTNDVLKKHKRDGAPSKTLFETWEHLQIQCALYINSEMSGLPPDMQPKRAMRAFTQRLKGKQGRFRGNLCGKRVDFSGRTVISPDPNLRIDQVGVPIHVAMTLTFPEIVNASNIEKMRQLVINGSDVHPGANYLVEKKTGNKKLLKYGKRDELAKNLRMGDTIERHLDDNDVVLFNRQPSLHKISIMSHRAKVMPGRTFRFNECACTPYNADFDGDEMNLHLPQTYEAKAEASELMNVKNNLITPRSGEPLVAAIQDFITGGYLLTHKDTFLPRAEVYRFAAALIDASAKKQTKIRIPPPAIRRPVELWTGKQLIELIIRPDKGSDVSLNLTAKNKSYTGNLELCSKDSYVIIRNSVLLAGCLDKSLLGSSSKVNIFYMLMRDYGEDAAVDAMWRLARMAPVFLSNRGFSIGIGDVRPSEQLLREKGQLVDNGYSKCSQYIKELEEGKLKAQPGCTEEETLESIILRELSTIRDHAGQVCLRNLSKYNAPLTMAVCGSKGSFINISQMIACVGQQAISGHRPPDGFEERSLPHFERKKKTPEAKGFVANSFYSGLTPTEFFFHTMGGREGLVDTAVKTAETGYMQRRLVKCLEDLCASYDGTVRSSVGDVIEFVFGEDGLDPAMMEAKDGSVVDFTHVLEHAKNIQTTKEQPIPVDKLDEVLKAEIQKKFKGKYVHFADKLSEYITQTEIKKSKKWQNGKAHCGNHETADLKTKESCKICKNLEAYKTSLLANSCLTKTQLCSFIELCYYKVARAITEPGTAVGAIAATSIGEPSTQMTLKTFHFAGVASMNITQGVPRIKEIINAVKTISTPIITAALLDPYDESLARRVKARIEKTTLGEICDYIEEVYLPDDYFLLVKLNSKRIRLLQLEVCMESISYAIATSKVCPQMRGCKIVAHGKTMMAIRPPSTSKLSKTMTMQILKYSLANVVVKGIPSVNRCVIHADEKKGDFYSLLVEGTDFRSVLSSVGVDPRKTNFNNALVVADVLGIEAARSCIINEIIATMDAHGIGLDRRHVMLLADVMTYRGEVLGITRNGLVKMKDSVLLLASFEKTMDHLFEAAFFSQRDVIHGVSECIIMGTPMTVGTGTFKLMQKYDKKAVLKQNSPIFERLNVTL
ncbi:DNA-directed RNA polymerase subunit [Caenorhabditis elegans]|uniref:DNA-directed RNA polymerase subunit n=1 Tax=Caenorhabditis elegans TaxID=6239 RepID=Q18566_CAEEL|nr:DNA-directed RNA polymerase subunit [Caenorhabditis elegans]CCD66619.1 DNA-directed RNA polymerase subunit [Caenorhabditis elegans]|eukprot:NP_501127.2 DNA-directed RNA polymerase subunit [Caenorhabditis elegans]